VLAKLLEGLNDVALLKFWAVLADNYNFQIAKSCQGFDRILEPLAERSPLLVMNTEGRPVSLDDETRER